MSIMNRITKIFNCHSPKKNDLNNLYDIFSQLSHDLKNNFVAIRASIGNVKQCINKPVMESRIDTIEKALAGIDKKINHSTTIINMMTTITSPACNWPKDITNISIKDCIQETIQSYPFSSDRHASFINIISPEEDYSVLGNSHLLKSVFYCLINNAVRSLYISGNTEAALVLDKNKVHFKFTDSNKITELIEQNIFSLGRPELPGNGLIFITNVVNSMNGNVELKQESNGVVNVTLLFSI